MNDTAVNLGAGGFVSYYENGGATVILDPSVEANQEFSEVSETTEITENLAKHNVKLVDYDEDENSIKNFLQKIWGRQPRGHIGPSSWLNPSGELTIYVPKAARETPEAFEEFITEEVKHIDQLREAPFSTALSNTYEKLKEKTSTIPSRLWSHVPEFVSTKEQKKYLSELYDVGMSGGDQAAVESPYWKQRSGIGQFLRGLHYDPYRDPESVEGIHYNKERYQPVLEKYGFTQEDQKGQLESFANGGATVILDPSVEANQEFSEEPGYVEKGVGSFIADQFFLGPPEGTANLSQDDIRSSGRTTSESRDVYYPEGQTFFEALADEYSYPTEELSEGVYGIDLVGGATRHQRPRQDMPTPQELEDVRAHMLGSALTARGYGPETSRKVGNVHEMFFGNRAHAAMDKRNNAVGIALFKKAGIEATAPQLAEMVDNRIFEQLNVILGRTPDEQGAPAGKPGWSKNFRSPAEGPDLYFPRDNSGYFLPDH
jgi:hypothetical protein